MPQADAISTNRKVSIESAWAWLFGETRESNQRAAAGGTTTGGAAEAVFAESDGSIFQSLRIDIPEEERAAIFPLHSELLVEIAIIDLAAPADAQHVAAHEAGNGSRVERLDEQLHVGFQLSVALEPGGEAGNRHVGNCVEAVKVDAEVVFEFALVVGFEFGLVGR